MQPLLLGYLFSGIHVFLMRKWLQMVELKSPLEFEFFRGIFSYYSSSYLSGGFIFHFPYVIRELELVLMEDFFVNKLLFF